MEIISLSRQKIGYSPLSSSESETLLDICLKDEKQTDFSYSLVGQLSKQIFIENVEDVRNVIHHRIEQYLNFRELPLRYEFESCWYNIMTTGDFNPLHDHHGNLSFVAIVAQNKSLTAEQEHNDYSGRLWFHTSTEDGYLIGLKSFVGISHFYIFNSTLNHVVYPYKAHANRYSIAGNLYLPCAN